MAPFLLEGLSQGKHTRLPQIDIHERFRPFVEDSLTARVQAEAEHRSCHLIIPTPEATDNVTDIGASPTATIFAAIGPEGGWVPFELDEFMQRGFRPVVLGRSVLRVEYAVMALLAQLEMQYLARISP